MMRAVALALLLMSVGARPAESALITITGQTPFVKTGGSIFPREGVYADVLRITGVGGLGIFEVGGAVATVWSTDTQRLSLWALPGSTLVSAQVSTLFGSFFVGGTSYAAGNYTLGVGDLGFSTRMLDVSFGPGYPAPNLPDRSISIRSVTMEVPDAQAVPEPSGLLLLGGVLTVMARSLRRTRG